LLLEIVKKPWPLNFGFQQFTTDVETPFPQIQLDEIKGLTNPIRTPIISPPRRAVNTGNNYKYQHAAAMVVQRDWKSQPPHPLAQGGALINQCNITPFLGKVSAENLNYY
jgi:hypothetical protein